jgi:hypothetical protein
VSRPSVPGAAPGPAVVSDGYQETTADIGSALNLSLPYVRLLVKRGLLPARIVGDRIRFNMGEVLAHVAAGKARPADSRRRPVQATAEQGTRRGPRRTVGAI